MSMIFSLHLGRVPLLFLGLTLGSVWLLCGAHAQSCQQETQVDLALLLDASGSVKKNNFQHQVAFAADLVAQFEVGPTKVKVAAVTFASKVDSQFLLNDYNDTQSAVAAIRQIPYSMGSTRTDLALRYARDVIFTPANGHRTGVPRVVLLATDGDSNNQTATSLEAQKLKKEGFTVFAIAIGNNLDLDALRDVATNASFVSKVDSFTDLQNFLPSLQSSICFELQSQNSSGVGPTPLDVRDLSSTGSNTTSLYQPQLQNSSVVDPTPPDVKDFVFGSNTTSSSQLPSQNSSGVELAPLDVKNLSSTGSNTTSLYHLLLMSPASSVVEPTPLGVTGPVDVGRTTSSSPGELQDQNSSVASSDDVKITSRVDSTVQAQKSESIWYRTVWKICLFVLGLIIALVILVIALIYTLYTIQFRKNQVKPAVHGMEDKLVAV
ncbi:hypothetical protein RRG08_067406 [Elysia crispata]|uniref:VWFA domain-containing protein n=1 Tax=Elysia crispata TaxID=231223 RepID=A0AAE0Y9C0_9GAST|nr:hypothetical protein RRG08_067406 [Elysia crispata]